MCDWLTVGLWEGKLPQSSFYYLGTSDLHPPLHTEGPSYRPITCRSLSFLYTCVNWQLHRWPASSLHLPHTAGVSVSPFILVICGSHYLSNHTSHELEHLNLFLCIVYWHILWRVLTFKSIATNFCFSFSITSECIPERSLTDVLIVKNHFLN